MYLDTRLILQKLEALYPPSDAHPSLAAPGGEARAIERLLSLYATDGGLFGAAVMMLPNLPQLADPRFLADRADMMGAPKDGPSPIAPEARAARRPDAVAAMRDAMELLETTLLADGRDWLLKTDRPTLADIEAVFIPYWVMNVPGAMPANVLGDQVFPKVHAWIARFTQAAAAAGAEAGAPRTLEGEAAAQLVFGSAFAEEAAGVDGGSPIAAAEGLRKGDVVRVWPTDSGSGHKEMGKLVGLTAKEIVLEAQGDGGSVRVHAPRHGFKVKKYVDPSSNL